VYFLLEFVLRVTVQKFQLKYLMKLDSFFEIFTTIPFFVCLAAFGSQTYIFQFFVMID